MSERNNSLERVGVGVQGVALGIGMSVAVFFIQPGAMMVGAALAPALMLLGFLAEKLSDSA